MNALTSDTQGMTLIETLVYLGSLAVVLTMAYGAYYEMSQHSRRLAANADDIVAAVRAGETWRGELRRARGVKEVTADGMVITTEDKQIAYRFVEGHVRRRAGTGSWDTVLGDVVSSRMLQDEGGGVSSYRWELELGAQRRSRVRPRFTFMAVPAPEAMGSGGK